MKFENTHHNDIERARFVLERHRETLMARANVIGVGLGLKQVGGMYTSMVALVVLVARKVPMNELEEKDRIPAEIDGVPVDVQETGPMNVL